MSVDAGDGNGVLAGVAVDVAADVAADVDGNYKEQRHLRLIHPILKAASLTVVSSSILFVRSKAVVFSSWSQMFRWEDFRWRGVSS